MASKIASEVREFAREQGWEVGTRGRMAVDVYAGFLSAQAPARVREIAAEVSVEVADRGKIKDEDIHAIAVALR